MRHELKNKIQRDVRAQISKGKFIVKLKEEYAFSEVTKNKDRTFYKAVIDNSVFKGKVEHSSLPSKLDGRIIFVRRSNLFPARFCKLYCLYAKAFEKQGCCQVY